MKSDVVVPALGESVVEARIAHWLKREGDRIEVGDVLVELETEKVNVEISAQSAGTLTRIIAQEEQTVHIGDVIGEIDETAMPSSSSEGQKVKEDGSQIQEVPLTGSQLKNIFAGTRSHNQEARSLEQETRGQEAEIREFERATPVARRVAEKTGLNLSDVVGSGISGRVMKHDVEAFIHSHEQKEKKGNGQRSDSIVKTPTPPAPTETTAEQKQPLEERVRMSLRRKTIARRMLEANQTTAMLTTFNEIDMSRVMELRRKYKDNFKEKYGIGLGIVSFFVKAVIAALKEFPRLNAEIGGDDIIYKYHYDIGVAIGAEEGLVVPVLRNADAMSFAEIEMGIKNFAEKSSNGTLTLDDLRGGTFTITNGGVFGSMMSTPILNPPQVGILGLHKIADRPIVENAQIVVKPMMYVALTYDHRIVDGRESVQFLVKVKELIEDPAAMVLE